MRKGFTLIELIFVIIIFGILSKFGAELLYKIYENYVYSNTYNRLLNQSEMAVKQMANRLQYRIKDSTISRDVIGGTIEPIGNNNGNEKVIEWIGVDIDGWRGTAGTVPDWSGFIDLRASTAATLISPATVLGAAGVVRNQGLFFIGSDVNLTGNGFGWNGNNLRNVVDANNTSMKVVDVQGTAITLATTTAGAAKTFTNSDVYEYYQLATSAYAISLEPDGTKTQYGTSDYKLVLYSGYRPWLGEKAGDLTTKKNVLAQHVKSFKFTSMGDILVVQVCLDDASVTMDQGGYAVCKEKVIF